MFGQLIGALLLLGSVYALPARPIHGKRRAHGAAAKNWNREKRAADDFAGYRTVGYFADWGIYTQEYFVTDLPVEQYTHLNYAFANLDADNGTVFLSDPYSDIEYLYPGDDPNEQGNQLFGNLKQFFLLKEKNRNLKTVLSVGGGGYSSKFANLNDKNWRNNFVASSIDLMLDFGFDGLDVDYGDPDDNTAKGTADLLADLRVGLDDAANKTGSQRFILSWAASCGSTFWSKLDVKAMDKSLDMWNLMAYDFSGAWTTNALPASNLYPDKNPANDQFASGSECAQFYASQSVDTRKMNLGMPLYGTAFNGTQGMWTKYRDLGSGDYGESGYYDDKHLPIQGEEITYDKDLGASWSTNNRTGHVVSFDTPQVALQKAQYVMDSHLGGMMFWSTDQDWTRKQSEQPTAPFVAAKWDPSRGAPHRASYGRTKGAPIDPNELTYKRDQMHGRGMAEMVEKRQSFAAAMDGDIIVEIGESLVDTVKTAFVKYGGGLDASENTIDYPTSSYDVVRDKS